MAIDPSAEYPGQIDTTDAAGYPLGKAQNVAAAGDGTGTPLEQAWLNDLWGFLQALLAEVGEAPSGTPDRVGASQYLDAIIRLANPETVITPAEITATTNNYAPTGHDRATVERWSSDGLRLVTGLSSAAEVKRKIIANVGANRIQLVHESASSLEANRFTLPGASSYTLGAGDLIEVIYDDTAQRWRVFGALRTIGTGSSDPAPIVLQANTITLSSANALDVPGANGIECRGVKVSGSPLTGRLFLSPTLLAGQRGSASFQIVPSNEDHVTAPLGGCRGKIGFNGIFPHLTRITRVQIGVHLVAGTGGITAKVLRKTVDTDNTTGFSHGVLEVATATDNTPGDRILDTGTIVEADGNEIRGHEYTQHLDVTVAAGDAGDEVEWILVDFEQYRIGMVSGV
jgi:hypothetical protein